MSNLDELKAKHNKLKIKYESAEWYYTRSVIDLVKALIDKNGGELEFQSFNWVVDLSNDDNPPIFHKLKMDGNGYNIVAVDLDDNTYTWADFDLNDFYVFVENVLDKVGYGALCR